MQIYEVLGYEPPQEPETDYFIENIINTFYFAGRSRQYQGMAGVPTYLSVKDITDVLEAHPVFIPRSMLDPCVFAIDNVWVEQAVEDMSKEKPNNTN